MDIVTDLPLLRIQEIADIEKASKGGLVLLITASFDLRMMENYAFNRISKKFVPAISPFARNKGVVAICFCNISGIFIKNIITQQLISLGKRFEGCFLFHGSELVTAKECYWFVGDLQAAVVELLESRA